MFEPADVDTSEQRETLAAMAEYLAARVDLPLPEPQPAPATATAADDDDDDATPAPLAEPETSIPTPPTKPDPPAAADDAEGDRDDDDDDTPPPPPPEIPDHAELYEFAADLVAHLEARRAADAAVAATVNALLTAAKRPDPGAGRIEAIGERLDRLLTALGERDALPIPDAPPGDGGMAIALEQINRELGRTRPGGLTVSGLEVIHTPDSIGLVARPTGTSEPGSPPAPDGFWAEITAHAEADDTFRNRWVYAWEEVADTGAAYAGWDAVAGGRTGTTTTDPARNTLEVMNTVDGACGNGVDASDLTSDAVYCFAMQAIPTGAIVWMRSQSATVDSEPVTKYWFSSPNGVDGECCGAGTECDPDYPGECREVAP